MKLIVCVDNNGGLSFFGKRLSKDRVVEADMKKLLGSSTLYAHPYSESFFCEPAPNFVFDRAYRKLAGEEDYVFHEIGTLDQKPFDTIIQYCWNRDYPQEEVFKPEKEFHLDSEEEFKGFSHEKITRKIFKR